MSGDLLRENLDAPRRRHTGGRRASADTSEADGQGVLAVHSLGKGYRGRMVVQDVSISVRRGEAVGLLGPNGAGKTTVFYMIIGLVKPDKGAIELDGHDVTRLPMFQRARLGVGYLPQEAVDLPRPQCRGQHPRGAGGQRARPGGARGGARIAARGVRHRAPAHGRRRSPCRAASGGAAKSRARSPASRPSCCSTSPSPASTRSPSATFRTLCAT